MAEVIQKKTEAPHSVTPGDRWASINSKKHFTVGRPDGAGPVPPLTATTLPSADSSGRMFACHWASVVHLSEFYLPAINWRVTLDFASHCRFREATMINVQINRGNLLTQSLH